MSELQPGQQVWFVRNSFSQQKNAPEAYKIAKVGRKWVSLHRTNFRFDRGTMDVDGEGYASPGRVYVSLEAYAEECRANEAWSALCARTSYASRPKSLSEQDILSAISILFPTPEPQQ